MNDKDFEAVGKLTMAISLAMLENRIQKKELVVEALANSLASAVFACQSSGDRRMNIHHVAGMIEHRVAELRDRRK